MDRYPVRAVASYFNCTPAVIYSFFKSRHWPIDGGLNESQLMAIYKHINGKNRKRPYRVNVNDVKRIQFFFLQFTDDQLQTLVDGLDKAI